MKLEQNKLYKVVSDWEGMCEYCTYHGSYWWDTEDDTKVNDVTDVWDETNETWIDIERCWD